MLVGQARYAIAFAVTTASATAASALAAGDARADSPSSVAPSAEEPGMQSIAAERRSGLVLGIAPGVGFAGASGYPNSSKVIGNPDFYSESPLMVGGSFSLLVMGAITDYLTFGAVLTNARFETEKWKSTGFGFGFRAEVFPLVRAFPTLADTAIYGQAGIGATELQAKGPFPSADGTQSFLGLGVHHEFRFFKMLGGHVSGGPFVEYNAIFSDPAERHWLSVGFRLSFYGGTVAADQR